MFKDDVYFSLIITNLVPESLGLMSNLRFLVPSNYCMATPIKSLFPPINPFVNNNKWSHRTTSCIDNSLCLSIFFFCRFSLICYFFIILVRVYSFYFGHHFLLWFGHVPLAFEFLGLFHPFFLTFLRIFHHYWSLKFHLPLVWSVILVGIFHERKFIQDKKRTKRDICILKCERNNKDDISSF
jgi:hypothetical protein